ncbi:hypothetical protein CWR43_21515 [Rhizobium sullae]|uniref:DUF930 domain-containing protein n=1 Tax=Rhizobium sullae TaxID=50338 RepID=A0A2N0D5N6_RHISU|nr:DUF930 domain-containing protein [Rhizobium sullae]PKA41408.1 hypothetical protein CWR43_21515 [Rhizobium sullae]
MVRPTQLFSAAILADPRSKQAREGMRQLATGERIVQLCNIEAMEQVHRWKAEFKPDFLVAYAMADTKLSGLTLQAEGGAFRSNRHWYNIKFKCEASPDIEKIVAFEFSVGEEIPESEWETRFLPADDGQAD